MSRRSFPLYAHILAAVLIFPIGCSERPTAPDLADRVVSSVQALTVDTGDSVLVDVVVQNASGAPTSAPVSWRITSPLHAEVTPGGWIRGLRFGETLAIATSDGATPDTVTLSVRKHVTHADVRPDSVLLLDIGETIPLTTKSIAYKAEVVGSYTWTSRDDGIATVDANGTVRAVNSGEVYIVGREAGGAQDSSLVRVTPPLRLSFAHQTGAVHIEPAWDSVMLDMPAREPVFVTVESSDSSILSTTPVTIPAGSRTARLTFRPNSPGSVDVTVSATGYTLASGAFEVGRPRIFIDDFLSSVIEADTRFGFPVRFGTEFDTSWGGRYVVDPIDVRVRSSDTSVLREMTIPLAPNSWEIYRELKSHGAGPVTVTVQGDGFISDSIDIEFRPAPFQFHISDVRIGARQHTSGLLFVPVYNRDTLQTSITAEPAGIADLSFWNLDSTSSTLGYEIHGLAPGNARIIASAPLRLPDTLFVTVTTPTIHAPTLPATPSIGELLSLSASVGDTAGFTHNSLDSITLRVTSSDPTVLAADTLVHVAPGSPRSERHNVRVVGPGSAYVTYTDTSGVYQPVNTNVVTVAP